MSAPSTLIAVIGEKGEEVVRRVAAGSINVGAEPVADLPSDFAARALHLATVWARARRHGLVYTLVNVDPLEPVVTEWAKRLVGEDHELDLAIAAVGKVEMPDYYLIDERLQAPLVDWYLAHLRTLAPTRVVPVRVEPGPLTACLGELPYGRPFPPGAEVAASARDFVPLPELVAVEHQFD
jgi:hypothetical protein